MCEYCKKPTKTIKWHRQDTDTNIAECFIHGASDGYAMFLRQGLKTDITDDLKVKINQMNEYAYIYKLLSVLWGEIKKNRRNRKW